MRLPSRPLFFLAGALAVLAGTAVAKSLVPVFLPAVSLSNLFPDVQEGTYFTESVSELVRKGILKGYEDGRFGPHDPVTRAQVAVMIDRYDREVVEPLRRQLWKIRQLLELGECGDGTVQIGEECDDGNVESGDGCSSACQKEVVCPPHLLDRTFPAPDGCNTCTCTDHGTICTKMACPMESECVPCGNECYLRGVVAQLECLPTTERFGCVFDGGKCVKVPGGEEEEEEEEEEEGEESCGNGVCEEGEGTWCPPCVSEPCPLAPCRLGTCPQDCGEEEGGGGGEESVQCEEWRQKLDVLFERERGCATDEDCTVFGRGCSPYLMCGKPVRKDGVRTLATAVEEYVAQCEREEPYLCTACAEAAVRCLEDRCTLQ